MSFVFSLFVLPLTWRPCTTNGFCEIVVGKENQEQDDGENGCDKQFEHVKEPEGNEVVEKDQHQQEELGDDEDREIDYQ